MADEISTGLNKVMGNFTGLTDVIIWLLIIGIVGVCVWGFFYYLSFKHPIRIRQLVNGRILVRDVKARKFKNKTEVEQLLIWNPRIKTGLPPDDCVDINIKGKLVAELELTVDGTVRWLKYEHQNTKLVAFTSEERTMLIHQFRESQQYKTSSWMDKLIVFAPIIAIMMILVLFMIFFNEAVAPTIELANVLGGTATAMTEATDRITEVCLQRPNLRAQNVSQIKQVDPLGLIPN